MSKLLISIAALCSISVCGAAQACASLVVAVPCKEGIVVAADKKSGFPAHVEPAIKGLERRTKIFILSNRTIAAMTGATREALPLSLARNGKQLLSVDRDYQQVFSDAFKVARKTKPVLDSVLDSGNAVKHSMLEWHRTHGNSPISGAIDGSPNVLGCVVFDFESTKQTTMAYFLQISNVGERELFVSVQHFDCRDLIGFVLGQDAVHQEVKQQTCENVEPLLRVFTKSCPEPNSAIISVEEALNSAVRLICLTSERYPTQVSKETDAIIFSPQGWKWIHQNQPPCSNK